MTGIEGTEGNIMVTQIIYLNNTLREILNKSYTCYTKYYKAQLGILKLAEVYNIDRLLKRS